MLIRQNAYNVLLIVIILINIDLSTETPSHVGCFVCNDKKNCVSYRFVCDGKYDCADHSDEKKCETKKPDECLPPIIEEGDYKVLGNNEYSSRNPIPNFSVVQISCDNSNYIFSTPYNTVHCLNGNYSHEMPKCVFATTCPNSFPYSIDVDCKLDGNDVDCTENTILVGTRAYMKCKPNFIDKTPDLSSTICLADGDWVGPIKECISPYKCPPRPSTAINVYCELNGVVQDCTKEVPDGTYSRMTCKPNYIDINDGPTVATCLNGTWTEPIKKCIPDCNQIVLEGQTHIVSGSPVNRGDFPWHVAIYRQKPKEPLDYICGGSIISVKVVLSAAHCFTDANNGNTYPVSEFSVAAGKKYNKWDAPEDEYYVQKRNVTKIQTLRDVYFGQLSSYAGDIAVVVVDKLFTFTNFVNAACVDWNLEYIHNQLVDGTLGKIAGWGSTATGNPTASVDLKQLTIPYVKRDNCVKIVPYHFIAFITVDKFCAGYTNGSSVCNGDSGGGMVFVHYNKYRIKKFYLQGIISSGPTKDGACDDYQLGVYTKVSNYISFIKEIEESNRM